MTAFARYCRFVLGYNLAVILWGAYVRASGSGAGCGSHWPLCNGEVVPPKPSVATWIEYSHRLSSGLVLMLVVVLAVWAFRVAPPGHPLRRGAILSLVFTLSEAAVGAGLVLFKLVAHDDSLARALGITTHLLNTLLLLASLARTAHAAGAFDALGAPAAGPLGPIDPLGSPGLSPALPPASDQPSSSSLPPSWTTWAFALAFVAVMAIGATGAVAALGDTLFPSSSLRQGLAQDLSPASHLLLRLRAFHPFLAVGLGACLFYLCQRILRFAERGSAARRWAIRLRLLVLGQWAVGVLNLGLLAPVALQLAHLLLADLLWISLVVLALETRVRVLRPAAAAPLVAAPSPT